MCNRASSQECSASPSHVPPQTRLAHGKQPCTKPATINTAAKGPPPVSPTDYCQLPHLTSNAASPPRGGLHDEGHAFSREAGWRSTLAPCTATSKTSSGRIFLAPTDTDEAVDPSEAISAVLEVFGVERAAAPETPLVLDALVCLPGQLTLHDVAGAPNTKYLSVCCISTRFEPINAGANSGEYPQHNPNTKNNPRVPRVQGARGKSHHRVRGYTNDGAPEFVIR